MGGYDDPQRDGIMRQIGTIPFPGNAGPVPSWPCDIFGAGAVEPVLHGEKSKREK